MEYISGLSITEHCDQHKLTIRERFSLFLDVCEAIQHTHKKGIIHRDIKPSNILVCAEDGKLVQRHRSQTVAALAIMVALGARRSFSPCGIGIDCSSQRPKA